VGRKSHYILPDNLKLSDKIFINALRCGGYATKDQILHYITGNRLRNYCNEKIISKNWFVINNKPQSVYCFTENGKAWVRNNIPELSDRKFYSSTGINHDLKLFEHIQGYTDKLSYEEQLNFRTESENRDLFKELCKEMEQGQYYLEQLQQHNISVPDFSYENEYVEAITNNYTDLVIQSKFDSMSVLGGSLTIIKS